MAEYKQLYDANDIEKNYYGHCTSAGIYYLVSGVDDEDSAIAVLKNAVSAGSIPETYDNLPVYSYGVSERRSESVWKVKITYKNDDNSAGNDDDSEMTYGFDTGSGTRHVDVALKQVCVYDEQTSRKYYTLQNVIRWNGKSGKESKVEGIDVPCANPRITFSKVFSYERLSTSYMRTLIECSGKVNASTWKGWQPGELLFLGANFSGNMKGNIRVTFTFSVKTNEYKAKVEGHDIGDVQGWQYVWTLNKNVVNSGITTTRVCQVYVATVFEATDFSKLGI